MRTSLKSVVALAGVLVGGVAVAPASATLVLSFGQPTYTISGTGQTVNVPVLLTQVAGGVQINAANKLISGGVTVRFDSPAGVAAVLAGGDITPSPLFALASTGVTATTASLTLADITGVGDLSSPLQLGVFKFTGLSVGTVSSTVASILPGPSFISSAEGVVDPTNTATARITVVPSPGSGELAAVCGAMALVARRRRA